MPINVAAYDYANRSSEVTADVVLIHPASCCFLSAACLQKEIREPPNLCLLPRPVLSQHSPVRTLTATTASALGEPAVNREKAEQNEFRYLPTWIQ